MFKIGDRVKFKKSSIDSGMIDATEEDVFTVGAKSRMRMLWIVEVKEWYYMDHFEHVKENIVNNTEEENIQQSGNYVPKIGDKVKGFKFSTGVTPSFNPSMSEYIGQTGKVSDFLEDRFKITFDDTASWYYPLSLAHLAKIEETQEEVFSEDTPIPWEVGQEVWCLLYGKGVVTEHDSGDNVYPVGVNFETGSACWYTSEGKEESDYNRSLFFSEPKIEAEKFPPKKPFTPALLAGEEIVVVHIDGYKEFITVMEDVEDRVFGDDGHAYMKCSCSFYKLGEEIKFN